MQRMLNKKLAREAFKAISLTQFVQQTKCMSRYDSLNPGQAPSVQGS